MPITLDEFVARLGAVDTPAKVVGILRPAAIATAEDAQGRALGRVGGGGVLGSRTGALRQSIAGSVLDRSGGTFDIVLRAGGRTGKGSVPYAAAHEFGTTIRPKRSKYLRIPVRNSPALTGAGVDKRATPLRQTGAGEFHVRKSPSGRLYLIHSATGKAWYKLVRESKIPARPFLRPSLTEAGEKLPARIARNLRDVMAGQTTRGGQ